MAVFTWPRQGIAVCLTAALMTVSLPPGQAQAGMVTTDRVVQSMAAEQNRDRIRAFLAREDVRGQLEAWGVDAAEAARRADGLTDVEITRIVDELDQLPAGQDAAVAIVSAGLVIFLVLVLTDLLGYTDVFSFVDPAE